MAGWLKESGASGTSNQLTLALGSVAAGRMIRVQVRIGAIGATVSCADDQDGAYTLAKSRADAADNTLYEFYLYPTVGTGSRTITVTTSAGTCRINASWFTVPTGATGVSVSATNAATGNGTSVASGNATAAIGDLVCGAADNTGAVGGWTAGGTSAGGSWATDQAFGGEGGGVRLYSQYVVATAGGTFASTPVYGGTDDLASLIVVYTGSAGSPPANTVAPAVTGTDTVGQTLSCSTGTWTGDVSSGYTYQWRRDNTGGGTYSDIASATSSTYVLVDADDACNIKCVVTATGTGGSASHDSNVVGPTIEPAPTNSVAPAVTGTTQVGSTLTTDNGTWAHMGGHSPTFTYQWRRDNQGGGTFADIGSATAATHVLVDADDACVIKCVVTAHNTNGSSAAATSSGTSAIAEPAPVNSVAPVASGAPSVGSTLSCTTGTWSHMGGNAPTFTYQWRRSSDSGGSWSAIGGATSSTYVAVSGDVGDLLDCVVTAHNTGSV